jgi:hypothetical protein
VQPFDVSIDDVIAVALAEIAANLTHPVPAPASSGGLGSDLHRAAGLHGLPATGMELACSEGEGLAGHSPSLAHGGAGAESSSRGKVCIDILELLPFKMFLSFTRASRPGGYYALNAASPGTMPRPLANRHNRAAALLSPAIARLLLPTVTSLPLHVLGKTMRPGVGWPGRAAEGITDHITATVRASILFFFS